MSDFLDVLNISKEQYADAKALKASADAQRKQQQQNQPNSATYTPYVADEFASNNKRRKISAMNRELYNLIGPNAPPVSLVPGSAQEVDKQSKLSKFKKKLDSKRKPWVKTGFRNQARGDDLVLYHWNRADIDKVALPSSQVPESPGSAGAEEANADADADADADGDAESKQESKAQLDGGDSEKSNTADQEEPANLLKDGQIMDEKVYRFAKYNTHLDIPSFTEEEYTEIYKDFPQAENKQPWTFEETTHLFELCKLYDMNWFVIYDRYLDTYHEMERDLEDLKRQMYTLSHKLLVKANCRDTLLLSSLENFPLDKEKERKEYLNRLIHRAPTEIAEEESLVLEARKFELAAKKMLLDRAMLLQLLDSPQASASIQQYTTSAGLQQLYQILMSNKTRKRKHETPVAPLLGPNAIPHTQAVSSAISTANKKKSNRGNYMQTNDPVQMKMNELQELLATHLTPEELAVYGIEIHTLNRLQPGVHMRSQKTATFKPSVQNKVVEILNQLGLTEKPHVPTARVVNQWDELANTIAKVVEIKKQTDKLNTELELIKRQKGLI